MQNTKIDGYRAYKYVGANRYLNVICALADNVPKICIRIRGTVGTYTIDAVAAIDKSTLTVAEALHDMVLSQQGTLSLSKVMCAWYSMDNGQVRVKIPVPSGATFFVLDTYPHAIDYTLDTAD